jgi:AhpD family alkylhydroperoxidase
VLEVYRLALHSNVHSGPAALDAREPDPPRAVRGTIGEDRMRIDYKRNPSVARSMAGLSAAVRDGPIDGRLIELVEIRASQLNGCAHCIELHTGRALALGESPERLGLLAGWPGAPGFTDRERAALRWAEELTLLSERDVPDDLYADVRRHFSEDELCQLTLAIVTINAWNRFAVAFRAPVGAHAAPSDRAAAADAHGA